MLGGVCKCVGKIEFESFNDVRRSMEEWVHIVAEHDIRVAAGAKIMHGHEDELLVFIYFCRDNEEHALDAFMTLQDFLVPFCPAVLVEGEDKALQTAVLT